MAMSKSCTGPEEDRTRFLRLNLIIIDELTSILQDLLHHEVDPNKIFNKVTRSGLNTLNANQWNVISTAKVDGYKNFDITLLYTLLRNVCPNITSPTQNWGCSKMPSQNDITVGDDIERIRLIRNYALGHISEAAIPQKEFEYYRSIVSDICSRMQALLNTNYVQRLQEIQECTMDSETESKYMDIIKGLTAKGLTSKENLEIEAKSPNKRALVETLLDISISILNEMVKKIQTMTSESEIDEIYESIEMFFKANREEIENFDLQYFFEELKEKITSYAKLQTSNGTRILAKFLEFILRLKKEYGACVESSRGSLVLLVTFSSKKGYDLYKEDVKNGEIGTLIQELFLYPPFLIVLGLKVEDLVVRLNGRLLTQEKITSFLTTNTSLTMDPQVTLHDVIRCHLCETHVPSKHCDICHIHLCEACVGDHLSDKSKRHNLAPYTRQDIFPKCQNHSTETCTERCQQCEIPICPLCVASGEHYQHGIEDIEKWIETKKDLEHKDLKEFAEKSIDPKYQEAATNTRVRRADVNKHPPKLTTALNKQGETLSTIIYTIIKSMLSKIYGIIIKEPRILTDIQSMEWLMVCAVCRV